MANTQFFVLFCLFALIAVGCGTDRESSSGLAATATPRLSVWEEISETLANDGGRAFMLSQPCVDILAEYRAMSIAGHNAALTHVANVYNIKTGTNPYIAVSDVRARFDQCS